MKDAIRESAERQRLDRPAQLDRQGGLCDQREDRADRLDAAPTAHGSDSAAGASPGRPRATTSTFEQSDKQ
jgi:hypothetical protein